MRAAPILRMAIIAIAALALAEPALAQEESVLTNLENQVRSATQG